MDPMTWTGSVGPWLDPSLWIAAVAFGVALIVNLLLGLLVRAPELQVNPDGTLSVRTGPRIVADLAVKIGEKIELGAVAYFEGPVTTYLHRRASDLPPAVGVLVAYEGEDSDGARAAAMQVAAMRPLYVSREEVPADVVAKEREIAEATAREEGKPEGALPRIVEGRVNGFFKDMVLLEQASVQDSKKSVKAVLDEAGVTVKRFARFEVGQV